MFEIGFYVLAGLAAVAAPFIGYLTVVGVVQASRHRILGWFHYCFYGIFLTVAVQTIGGGRDLSAADWLYAISAPTQVPGWVSWETRIVSMLLALAAAERIAAAIFRTEVRGKINMLLLVFVVYWMGVVVSPALLGRYPRLSHDYLYPMLFAVAGLLASRAESQSAIAHARNALLLFVLAGVLAIPFKSGLVLETQYNQGYLPGVPRMAGLAGHALQLGLIVQVAMLCLWAKPFRSKLVNQASWILCLVVLLLAQSKTAWVSFLIAAITMLLLRHGPIVRKRAFDPEKPTLGILLLLASAGVALLAAYTLASGELGTKIARFFDTDDGVKLLSFNGREQIWAITFAEWRRNPLFGYGPTLFSLEYRQSIGMLNATHAHNQFVDDLGRAGLVGVTALIAYVTTLVVLSIRLAKATGGFSVALLIVIVLRGISEVPLGVYVYGVDFAVHLLLLMVLAGAGKAVVPQATTALPSPTGLRPTLASNT